MMKLVANLAASFAFALALAASVPAGDEVTLTGDIACAHCTLKRAGVTACQDVLVVAGAQAGDYYIVKNSVSDTFGHTCQGKKAAKVTGSVSEKDGKKWITASKIEAVKG